MGRLQITFMGDLVASIDHERRSALDKFCTCHSGLGGAEVKERSVHAKFALPHNNRGNEMEELLRRIVDQNDALIDIGNRTLSALQEVVDELDHIRSETTANNPSLDLSLLTSKVENVVVAVENIGDRLAGTIAERDLE
jgi:hypothetical protein